MQPEKRDFFEVGQALGSPLLSVGGQTRQGPFQIKFLCDFKIFQEIVAPSLERQREDKGMKK